MMEALHTAQDALDQAIARYEARHPTSKALHEQAIASLPGGNTRTVLHTSPFPIHIKSGKGHQVTDEDGHVYTDIVAELTAGLYGHSNPTLVSAIQDTLSNTGLNLGGTTHQEALFASAICQRFNLERVRFTNSGTEATLHALAAARAHTGKRKVIVFDGGYHGGVFSFADGKPARNAVDRDDWIVARFNDVGSVRTALTEYGQDVAAILMEQMLGSGGAFPATEEFLRGVKGAAEEAGVLVILDEVMTSRLAPGGLAAKYWNGPVMKTFGKWLGGGLAFGAFGGPEQVMNVFNPTKTGALPHSGTFNNNSLAMRAGFVGLTKVYTPDVCEEFNRMGDAVRLRLGEVCKGTRLSFTGSGTVWASHFWRELPEPLAAPYAKEDDTLKELFWFEMLEEGFWLTKRGTIALILGTPQGELDRLVDCVAKFISRHKHLLDVTS